MRAPPNNPLQLPFVATGIDAAQHAFFNGRSAPPAACVSASETYVFSPARRTPVVTRMSENRLAHMIVRETSTILSTSTSLTRSAGCIPAIDQATARYSLLMPATFFTLVAGYFASRQMFVEDQLPRTA